MHDRRESPRPGGDDRLSPSARRNDAEETAVKLHAANRRRAQHFNAPVMTDAAMDIMLSLFVAQEHKRPLALVALAMANTISQDQCAKLLADLCDALLVNRSAPHMPITLTERGARLMREYLERMAPLAA